MWGTSRKLRQRLFDELRSNLALKVEETGSASDALLFPVAENCTWLF